MNPNNKTWQDRAKEYIELRKNPLSNQNSIEELRKGFELINIFGLSNEDRQLLAQVFSQ